MFNGVIYFRFSPNGYVVDCAYEFGDLTNEITNVWSSLKQVRIQGNFKFMPKRGQFCKRPHKLIDFENSYERNKP